MSDEDKKRGLYPKYEVRRASDGTVVEDFCFVLVPSKDPIAREVLESYAHLCRKDYPKLANDLYEELGSNYRVVDGVLKWVEK